MEITEFLKAQLDADEDVARAWRAKLDADIAIPASLLGGLRDPNYMLSDIAAKRAILDIHKIYVEEKSDSPNIKYSDTWKPDVGCVNCDWDNDCRAIEDNGYPCDTVRLLAQPYADHPDYQQEWKVPR